MNPFRTRFGVLPSPFAVMATAFSPKRAGTRRASVVAAGALTLAAGSVAMVPVAQAAPGPRFGANSLLASSGVQGLTADVPGLTVDPANANHVVEANVDPINLQCDYHVSFDAGKTWTGGHLTLPSGSPSPGAAPFPSPACDQNYDSGGYQHFNTGIVFGSGQNVYATFSIHRGPFNRPESDQDGGEGDDSVVAKSTDGGRTFQPAVIAVPGGGPTSANPGLAGHGMRPQIAVQPGAGPGGQDRLYVASWDCYIRIRLSQGGRGGCSGGGGDRRILVARSDDGGATWQAPALASGANVRAGTVTPPTGAAGEAGSTDEQATEPTQPVVGPDGAVYVGWKNRDITDGTSCPVNPNVSGTAPGNVTGYTGPQFTRTKSNCVVVAKSTDQGATWTQVATQSFNPASGLVNPRLAMDPTAGPTGRLYVVYADQSRPPTDPKDILLTSSSDGDTTWSSRVRVNDDPAGPIQQNPWVSVGSGGQVDVVWYDRRHPYPGGGKVGDVYSARSTDGGLTFAPNRRVTDRSINVDVGRYDDFGENFTPGFDWYGPVALPLPGGKLLTAWSDSRRGNYDNGFQDVYLSPLDPSAPIATSNVATATPPGLSVLLSRLAFPGGPEDIGNAPGTPVTKVVVANQGDVAGALAGAVLARANWGPLLLSPPGGMPPVVKAESARMVPEGGFVIGDATQLSPAVSSDLRDTTRNGENVSRVAAAGSVPVADRPAEIARQIGELMRPLPSPPEAVIANPASQEAASASALAAALKIPILFVDNRDNSPKSSLPGPTSQAITSLGITKVLIVGGTQAVNAPVEASLNAIPQLAGNVRRLNGADVNATSDLALTEEKTRGLPINVVYVADGTRPIDGALLGAAVGRLNGGMLLTPSASTDMAQTRLGALGGIDTGVDRLVSAVGIGGTDPTVPPGPSPSPSPGTGTGPAPLPGPGPSTGPSTGTGPRPGVLPRANLPGLRLSARRVRRGSRTVFIVRGSLRLPPSIPGSQRSRVCHGSVTVAARRGSKTGATKTVGLRKDCSFSVTLVASTSKLGRKGRYNVRVRFHGNTNINARSQTTNIH